MKLSRRAKIRTSVAAAVAAMGLVLWMYLATPEPEPGDPLPNPNGYDDFLAAANMLSESSVTDWSDNTNGQLGPLLAANSNAFARLRLGIERPTSYPLHYFVRHFEENQTNIRKMKRLAMAMSAKGKIAAEDQNYSEAAGDYLDLIAFGLKSGRGAFIINSLVSIAIEAIGERELSRIVPDLDAVNTQHCLAELKRLETERASFAQIEDAENYFAGHYGGWRERFAYFAERITGTDPAAIALKGTRTKYLRVESECCGLENALAAHLFLLQKGRAPATWSDLVPAYLPVVPTNRLSGQLFTVPEAR